MTLYEVLGMTMTATQEELRAAYMELAKKLHPDVGLQPNGDGFAAVTAAYTVLKDAGSRKEYDATLRLLMKKCPACKGSKRKMKRQGFREYDAGPCPECSGAGMAKTATVKRRRGK